MYSFLLSVCALILGYIFYGKYLAKVIDPDIYKVTPAYSKTDGVDFMPLPTWKVFMIQFLNIAGTGPIFGALMGAKFGPACYLWIVFGCIFAGATHDYLAAMLSLKDDGASLPQIVGKYLGKGAQNVMLVFTMILMLLVGAVFAYSPASILGDVMASGDNLKTVTMMWVLIIFGYYIIATMLPISKVIGKVYPVFSVALIFMAIALMIGLLIKWPTIPEFWDGLSNLGAKEGLSGLDAQTIFPCLFITVACGAISGFHATQSPMMARCIKNEHLGRPCFYGAMITEGIIALVWAALGSYFVFDGGWQELGASINAGSPVVVKAISIGWLGVFGGVLAVLGVVVAPITSGDTAFRSARLIVADALNIDQKPIMKRLMVSVPLFVISALILWYSLADADGFNLIWRYFGWANQTLAIFTLWAITVYLYKNKSGLKYLITMIPACFMTSVCITYISVQKIGFNLPMSWSPWIGIITFVISAILFFVWKSKSAKSVE
ncbi:MAG: carbon starvation protein A [Bacteroidales bacterium]|nr:carbon starvation protein A [Bacteroidales bacterium]